MYYTTVEFFFDTNDELDEELTRLYNEEGMEVVAIVSDRWYGKEYGGKTIIKFKVK